MIWGGAEAVMLALGSGCKYRWSLAERFDCTETIINQLLADSYQNPIREWQVITSSGFPLILHYGELYNYFIMYYNVIIIEIKCAIHVIHLNHPWSMEKLSCMKLVPVAKKVGDRWCRTHAQGSGSLSSWTLTPISHWLKAAQVNIHSLVLPACLLHGPIRLQGPEQVVRWTYRLCQLGFRQMCTESIRERDLEKLHLWNQLLILV